jgi:hypothetical protein
MAAKEISIKKYVARLNEYKREQFETPDIDVSKKTLQTLDA